MQYSVVHFQTHLIIKTSFTKLFQLLPMSLTLVLKKIFCNSVLPKRGPAQPSLLVNSDYFPYQYNQNFIFLLFISKNFGQLLSYLLSHKFAFFMSD